MSTSTHPWNHHRAAVNGIRLHYVRHGRGSPLVLLHGWPEFWLTWRKNIPVLAERFDVVAPDLRGFGASDKPAVPAAEGYTLDHHVADLLGLADALGLSRVGLVSHDVGAYVAQAFARAHPDRVWGLFFFNCPYPGIGRRWAEPDHLREIWYQSFNQQPWAADLVGRDRRTCALYVGHFLAHWSHDPRAFDEDLDAWVDNFLAPGALQGGFNWYIVANAARLNLMKHGPPALPRIEAPTRVRWGAEDPVLKAEWADRLGDYFAHLDFAPLPGAGHFAHYERPEQANRDILEFFAGLAPPATQAGEPRAARA